MAPFATFEVDPTDVHPLVGVWSLDARYEPGTQDDEVAWFRADGEGRFEHADLGLYTVHYFNWEPVAPGVVHLQGTVSLQQEDEHMIDAEPFHPAGIEFNYSIAVEESTSGDLIEVLRIALGFADGAFAKIDVDGEAFEEPTPRTI